MTFDDEGHLVITPAGVVRLLQDDLSGFVCNVLIPGTPAAFRTFDGYCRFRSMVARELAVHPSSIVLRGSTKFGFSLTPRPEKLWVEMGPDSDIDLAIVDADHFHFLDAEVRRWERDPTVRAGAIHGKLRYQFNQLSKYRSFYCYRYMDLPVTALVQRYQAAMEVASSAEPPGCHRQVTAFFFRDWWSLQSRYESDLRQLLAGLRRDLPRGEQKPRSRMARA